VLICTVPQPPGVYPIAVNKYINININIILDNLQPTYNFTILL